MTEQDIPRFLKLTMVFIDRVGFPTMAFMLMSYMCFVTLHKITDALLENTKALTTLSMEFQSHQEWAEKIARDWDR